MGIIAKPDIVVAAARGVSANKAGVKLANEANDIEIAVPRILLDAKKGKRELNFYVLIDGRRTKYGERKDSDYRILTIEIKPGDTTVEIFGNNPGPSPVGPAIKVVRPS